jgi:hypothetical protein
MARAVVVFVLPGVSVQCLAVQVVLLLFLLALVRVGKVVRLPSVLHLVLKEVAMYLLTVHLQPLGHLVASVCVQDRRMVSAQAGALRVPAGIMLVPSILRISAYRQAPPILQAVQFASVVLQALVVEILNFKQAKAPLQMAAASLFVVELAHNRKVAVSWLAVSILMVATVVTCVYVLEAPPQGAPVHLL